ncbi:MAG: EAL domain-containing protein [Betaproteobacteria bacterium]
MTGEVAIERGPTGTVTERQAIALVVDDESTQLLLSRAALERVGFLVETADDPHAALALADKMHFDVVFMDVDMPDMDGYALCRLMRSRPQMRYVPIVMVTGREDMDSIDRAYAAGATDFIAKPINWALLGHRARYILRSGNLVRDLVASEEKFRLITENISDFISMLDLDGTRIYNSPSFRRLFGGTDLTGTDSFAEIHPEDRESIRQILRETATTGAGNAAKYRLLLQDGSVRYIESEGSVIRDEAGEITKVVVISRDVTERRAQQDKIDGLSRISSMLSGINSALVRIRDRQELFDEACRIAVQFGHFKLAWIGVVDAETGDIRAVASAGEEQDHIATLALSARADAPGGRGMAGRAIRGKQAEVSNDISTDATPTSSMEKLARGFRSMVVLPLMVGGEAIGVFVLYAAQPGVFNAEEMRLLEELASDVSFGLDYMEQERRLHHLAYYDALTGLPNRSLFVERLGRLTDAARPSMVKVAVVILDVRGFHIVNDNLGRHAGDTLLKMVADRLQRGVRAADTVSRIGGDQFGLILTEVNNESHVGQLLQKICGSLDLVYPIADEPIHLAVKGGVAIYPVDGANAEALMTSAEAAMKRAKAALEPYLYYAPDLNAAYANRLLLESKLRRALDQQQFVLYYQPKVDAASGRISGLEALLRWIDPELGVIMPLQFVPLLEDTGMIKDVGAWIFRQAMIDLQKLRASGQIPPRIAVNVSAVQLRQRDFPAYVADAIGGSAAGKNSAGDSGNSGKAIGTSGLEIEVTETVLMDDIEHNVKALQEIRNMGIGVSLDDFGTGYSSLNYVARLPANTLKLDQSFVANLAASPEKLAIVSAVITLGHALGMRIVAEGVETEEQAGLLRRLKCDELQGYLFSRPLPLEQLELLFSKGTMPWDSKASEP